MNATEEKSIKAYRAIWGKGGRGVSDEELRRNGMFTRNYYHEGKNFGYPVSPEQEQRYKDNPALPVYLYREQPLSAIIGRKGRDEPIIWEHYEQDTGILAEAEIPYSLLFGSDSKLRLTRDSIRGTFDTPRYEVTKETADKFISGELPNHGEFSIRPRKGVSLDEFRRIVRSLEHLYRPKVNEEGTVISEELEEVHLPPEPDETKTEVSRL